MAVGFPPLLSSYKAACKLAFSTAVRAPFSSCFVVCAHSEAKKELPEGQFVADYLNGESRFIRGGGGGGGETIHLEKERKRVPVYCTI